MKKIRQILSSPEWWLIIIPIIAYRQIAFFQNTMMWDMTDQAFVWHRFISECFHQHILPLWCPYNRLGYPFFADPQSGLFYPVVWIFTYFFDYSLYTNNAEYIAHVIGAAFGMRFLLRALGVSRYTACVFGVVYALSGPFVSNASHNTFVNSLCWMPFIMGSYIRVLQTGHYRYVLLMAVFLLLQISGGYVGLSIILFYILGLVFLYYLAFIFPSSQQRLPPLIFKHLMIGVITTLLSAGYVYAVSKGLPFIDRKNGVSPEMANSVAFTPSSFLTLLFPFLVQNDFIRFGTDLTMRNSYIGSLTLILVMVSLCMPRRAKWIVLAGSIFFLMAALGGYTPVRGWLYSYIPLMNLFRMAAIFRFFACIGLILLAAFGFDEIFEKGSMISLRAVKVTISALGPLMIIFLAGIIFMRMHELHHPVISSLPAFAEYLRHATIPTVLVLHGLIHVFILGSAFFVLLYFKTNLSHQKYLFAGLIILDMGIAVQGSIFSTVACPRSLAEVQAGLDKLPKGFPVVPNVVLATYNEWNDSSVAPPIWHNAGFLRKQITFDGFSSYCLREYERISDGKNFYNLLIQRKVISTHPDSAKVSIVSFSPDRIGLAVSNDSDMTLLLGQMYFPGWRVSVDSGASSAMIEDSLHFMTCNVPHGEHRVQMTFEPGGIQPIFIYSVLVFVISMIAVLIFFIRPLIL